MEKVAGIYKITSPSGRVYIGQSWDIHARWRQHRSAAKHGTGRDTRLIASLRKHGFDNHVFTILYVLPDCPPNNTQYNLDIWEQFLMDEYRVEHISLLNLREAGSSGRQSKESIAKMVETRRANGSYVVSEATREKYRQAQKGRKGVRHSDEVIRRIADKNRGRIHSPEENEKNRQAQLGRKHSAETKAKIAAAHIGRRRPDLAERNRLRARSARQSNPDQRGLF